MASLVFILTSHTDLGGTGKATGFYFEELATPYYALVDAGHDVVLASVRGGAAPHDPGSLSGADAERPESVRRFLADPVAMAKLSSTIPLAELRADAYDGVFLPGGHGVMWDFPGDPALAALVGGVYDRGGVVGAVCHGPAGLVDVVRADGRPLVEGLRVAAFTDAEEEAVGLTGVVPFLLETRLRALGGLFEPGPLFGEKAVRDGRLVTGQNPPSSEAVARLLLEALDERA